jgi:hypothetical protein
MQSTRILALITYQRTCMGQRPMQLQPSCASVKPDMHGCRGGLWRHTRGNEAIQARGPLRRHHFQAFLHAFSIHVFTAPSSLIDNVRQWQLHCRIE